MSSTQLKKIDSGHFQVFGELSMGTVPALLSKNDLCDIRGVVTIDLKNVDRADSAGVALLVEWQRAAKQKQQTIRFQNISPQMLAIARLCGVDELLALT